MASNAAGQFSHNSPGDSGEARVHPLELYLQLAGATNKLQAFRRVQEWLRLPSVEAVARNLLVKDKLSPPPGEPHAVASLEALLVWKEMPPAWRRFGYALLWRLPPDEGRLVDCDGQAWEVADLVAEWEELLTDPDGHALALTALKLVRNYRHVLWEYLLRQHADAGRMVRGETFARNDVALLELCLAGSVKLGPPKASGPFDLVGELFSLDEDFFFIAGQTCYELEMKDDLVDLLEGRGLGRARMHWVGKWELQWVEVEGDLIRVGF
jgi:hypothetical protein